MSKTAEFGKKTQGILGVKFFLSGRKYVKQRKTRLQIMLTWN
jgi:hypothetical protein